MPARWVPLLYFAFAHLSLAAAFAALAFEPRGLAGFFYHPRMLAVVHLVTLGWISGSILGAVYVIGPLAFRMPLPARGADYAAFVAFALGVCGMASHFWMDSRPGMAWSAGLVVAGMSYVAVRGLLNLRSARAPLEARLPMGLAFLNVIAAAGLGLLLAVNKVSTFLPVAHLDAVYAHAHLAALGWGTMMVVGAGYRMMPMILPAAMPHGFWAYASAVLLEAGVAGLVLGFLAAGGPGRRRYPRGRGIVSFSPACSGAPPPARPHRAATPRQGVLVSSGLVCLLAARPGPPPRGGRALDDPGLAQLTASSASSAFSPRSWSGRGGCCRSSLLWASRPRLRPVAALLISRQPTRSSLVFLLWARGSTPRAGSGVGDVTGRLRGSGRPPGRRAREPPERDPRPGAALAAVNTIPGLRQ
jgi:hypothetical protein